MDALDLKSCINRNITLKTKDGKIHEGSIYTIDPVSGSIVIYKKTEYALSAELILKHAVSEVLSVGELNPISMEEEKERIVLNLTEVREHLKNWLEKNLIPIEESGECLTLAGGQLTITPPYAVGNCLSYNEVVLNKIQKLIKRMPPYKY